MSTSFSNGRPKPHHRPGRSALLARRQVALEQVEDRLAFWLAKLIKPAVPYAYTTPEQQIARLRREQTVLVARIGS